MKCFIIFGHSNASLVFVQRTYVPLCSVLFCFVLSIVVVRPSS
jgi:hypothetical protein